MRRIELLTAVIQTIIRQKKLESPDFTGNLYDDFLSLVPFLMEMQLSLFTGFCNVVTI